MAIRINANSDNLVRTTNLPTLTAFTMMCWGVIRFDKNNWSCLMHRGATFNNYHYIGPGSDGTTLNLLDSAQSGSGTNLNVDQWYHVAFVRDGDTRTVYLDGVQDIQNTTGSPVVTDTQMTFANNADSEDFNGCVAAIKVWDRVLTQAEVNAERYFVAPWDYANLNNWLPCWGPGSTDLGNDYSGNGYDFTVNGTVEVEPNPPIPFWPPFAKNFEQESAAAPIAAIRDMIGSGIIPFAR